MSDVTRSIKEGTGFGLIAGVVFALAQVLAAAITEDSAIVAFRRFASVLLGPEAMFATPAATAVVIGLVGHLILSAMFGLFYGIYNSALTMETRRSFGRQALVGPLYGLMLWLVNFQVFARYRYPWLLDAEQASQAVLHAIYYGLPLGLLYAGAERRVKPTRRHYDIHLTDWRRPLSTK